MSGIFVEYALKEGDPGYSERALNILWPGRPNLRFVPDPAYGGRRVESFPSEEEAMKLVRRYHNGIFAIARDLISKHEQDAIEAKVAELVIPLQARVDKLEAAIEKLNSPRRGRPKAEG